MNRRAISKALGFRGSFLLAFAFIDLLYAASLANTAGTPIDGNATYRWFAAVMPLGFWAAIWAAVGIVCATCAFLVDDRIGFIAAIGIKIVWASGSLFGCILGDVSLGAVGLWIGMAFVVWRIAGLPEPRLMNEDHEV